MFDHRLASANERLRLQRGPAVEEKPEGLGTVRLIAKCRGNAHEVLEKVKEVLKVVNENTYPWPSDDFWRRILPAWFVNRCAPEPTEEECKKYLRWWYSLPLAKKQKVAAKEEKRTLCGWIFWFHPDNRHWYWWDGLPLDKNQLAIDIEVYDWPYALGALHWLLRAAGAKEVQSEE